MSLIFRVSKLTSNEITFTIVCFTRHVYIVDNLKTKMLLSNDILKSKQIILNLNKKKIIIDNCQNCIIDLNVINRDIFVKQQVKINDIIKISTRFCVIISFKLRDKSKLSKNKNFMFLSQRIDRLNFENDVLSHIVDVNTTIMQIRNINIENVFLFKNCRINTIQKYEEKNCYVINIEHTHLTIDFDNNKSTFINWFKKTIKIDVAILTIETTIVIVYQNLIKSNIFDNNTKIVTSIEITIYDEILTTQIQLANVIEFYFNLWHDDDTIVRISLEKWMSIKFRSKVKIEAIKIYSLKSINRQFVDEICNKLHIQDRMKYITQSISYNYSIFVVWRIVFNFDESKKKSRVVINIRDLNKISITNSYSMSLQLIIIFVVIDCLYIFVFDVVEFFYQWLMFFIDKHKFIVISYREQKQFNVIVIKFKNSSFYVQRKIDVFLQIYRVFARVYMNNIVIFNYILKKHISHLHVVFQLFDNYEINLSLKKFFLKYFIVNLLSQKIDAFDLTTTIDKLKIIVKLNFLYTLKNLKIYLEMIDWLRDFIFYYAQKIDVLQKRKTLLLRQFSFNKNVTRKMFFKKIIIENLIVEKLKSFRQLQKSFKQTIFLMHFFDEKILYVDIDASKRRDFETMIYHLKFNCLNLEKLKRVDIESILFFSRMLNVAKTKY